jgi:hypothetical protein
LLHSSPAKRGRWRDANTHRDGGGVLPFKKTERRAARIIHPPMDPHGARGRPLKGREKRRLLKIYQIGRN